MASMDVPYQRILTFVLRSFHRRTAVFYVPYCQYAYSILVPYKFCPEGFMLFTRHVVNQSAPLTTTLPSTSVSFYRVRRIYFQGQR